MKTIKNISTAAILFSTLLLGITITNQTDTAQADNATTETNDRVVSNTIVYEEGNSVVNTSRVTGTVGYQQAVVAPAGYKLADPTNNFVTLLDGVNPRIYVKVTKLAMSDPVTTTINYIDSATNQPVGKQTLTGYEDQTFALNAPNLYKLDNSNDTTYTLIKNVYSRKVYVSREKLAAGEITNTVRYRIKGTAIYVGQQTLVSGKPGSQQAYEAPAGYRLAFNQSSIYFISSDRAHSIHIADVQKDESAGQTKINFVELGTGVVIGNTMINGDFGQTLPISFPNGYEPINNTDQNLVLRPYENQKDILVKKSNKDTNNDNGTVQKNNLLVKSLTDAPLYDVNGKKISNRSLGLNSEWASDRYMVLNGTTYYRVSTNEWAKASDMLIYYGFNSTVTTKDGENVPLFSANGTQSNRNLSPNTKWATDKYATINGVKMFRVSTNEWVRGTDLK